MTATNGAGSASATSAASPAVLGGPPANTALPDWSGWAHEGYDLDGALGTWTSSAGTISYATQWLRCDATGDSCIAIAGADAQSYAVIAADVSMTLRLAVTATNSAGSTTARSEPTPPVQGDPPTNGALKPEISGQFSVGGVISATSGQWSGTTPFTYAYQWERCAVGGTCAAITGATNQTYTAADDDVDHALAVVVSATNQVGNAAAESARSAIVRPSAVGQSAMDAAVGSLYAGSWLDGPDCDAACQTLAARERSADSDTQDQLLHLRLHLGLLGPIPGTAAARAARQALAKEVAPPPSVAGPQILSHRWTAFGPLPAEARSSSSTAHAAQAPATDEWPDDLTTLYAMMRDFRLRSDTDILNIEIRTSSGRRLLWPWHVPYQGYGVPADFPGIPGWTGLADSTVNVGWMTWAEGGQGGSIPIPTTGWYGQWNQNNGTEAWTDMRWQEDGTCASDGDHGTRPLQTPAGFSRYQYHMEWDHYGYPCTATDGYLRGFAMPAGPIRPWTSSDPDVADGTLNATALPPDPAPSVSSVYSGLCELISSGDYPKADAALDHPCDRKLAEMFRPKLLFDTAERCRPLDVDRFLSEQTNGQPSHAVCIDPDRCTWLTDPTIMGAGTGASSYLSINAASDGESPYTYKDAAFYRSPDQRCWGEVLLDCDTGPSSANYYTVSEPSAGGYRYIDYWNFYRVNYFGGNEVANEFNHQGDWEAVSVAPSRTHWGTFDFVSFSQHDGPFKSYLRENLRCDDVSAVDQSTCGTDADPHGTRVISFVASGSHANYARPCSETVAYVSCEQEGPDAEIDGVVLPERGHDGAAPWGNNDNMATLREFPKPGDGRPYDWGHFPGRWGVPDAPDWDQGPESPLNQPHASAPSDTTCARHQDGCALASSAHRSPSTEKVREHALASCDSWFGPDVQAALCAPSTLADAVRGGRLGRAGRIRLVPVDGRAHMARGAQARAAAQSAPGLAQRVGVPLRAGERLAIDGHVPAGALLLVRVGDGRRVWDLRFRMARSSRSGVLIVNGGGRGVIAFGSGRVGAPVGRHLEK